MNILIVDDIVINRFIVREIVKKAGHSVFEAGNGKIALEILEKENIDIIFMDIEMPVMNGIEAVKNIREKFPAPKKDIKIIAITAYNPSILQGELDLSMFDTVITKPYSTDKINNIIVSSNSTK